MGAFSSLLWEEMPEIGQGDIKALQQIYQCVSVLEKGVEGGEGVPHSPGLSLFFC